MKKLSILSAVALGTALVAGNNEFPDLGTTPETMNFPACALNYRQAVIGKELPGKYALLLFLHGAGERGDDNARQQLNNFADIIAYCRGNNMKIIVLAVTAISRVILVLIYRHRTMTEVEYMLWQVCEWLAICLFSDLFLCLMFPPSFLELLPKVLLVGIALMVFPYLLFNSFLARRSLQQIVHELRQLVEDLKSKSAEEKDSERVEFVDEKGVIRLVTSQHAIVYIEAAGNYVDILYEDRGKLTHFALRNTLKGIEALCVEHNLLRCHRSYFINLDKIKLLRRDANGLFAEMNVDGVGDLPVSKNYANEITSAFSHV